MDLPLLCGVAGFSREASEKTIRGAINFLPAAGVFHPPNWKNVPTSKSPFVPFCLPSWVFCSLCLRLCDPALYLPPLVWSIPPKALQFGPAVAAIVTLSSLCAPSCKRSNSVSVDGVLQEPRHLLNVLLNSTNSMVKICFKIYI